MLIKSLSLTKGINLAEHTLSSVSQNWKSSAHTTFTPSHLFNTISVPEEVSYWKIKANDHHMSILWSWKKPAKDPWT